MGDYTQNMARLYLVLCAFLMLTVFITQASWKDYLVETAPKPDDVHFTEDFGEDYCLFGPAGVRIMENRSKWKNFCNVKGTVYYFFMVPKGILVQTYLRSGIC